MIAAHYRSTLKGRSIYIYIYVERGASAVWGGGAEEPPKEMRAPVWARVDAAGEARTASA
jgi:hypothetical protein